VIEVVTPGPLATVQDLGRPGYRSIGVPLSGGFDRAALRAANRLVGNRDDAAVVEFTLGGAHLLFSTAATVAFTGAACTGPPDWGAPVTVPGDTGLRLGPPARGLRSYLAVRGGIDVDPVLGSRSTDLLSGLGPPPLRAGDRLAVGAPPRDPVAAVAAVTTQVAPSAMRVRMGPRDDWFTEGAGQRLTATTWTVRGESDRVGIRLDGPSLVRRAAGELPSEPMLPGALQVPPDGRPILFGPDSPVTGGYPVIAVVLDADLDRAAQLRPGETVRFTTARFT
jgi:biotin-dependent carboxylase-like uncharacterized protein